MTSIDRCARPQRRSHTKYPTAGRYFLSALAAFSTVAALDTMARAELRITEVMPNGLVGVTETDEWIELYNAGPDVLDLSAYRIGDEEQVGAGEGFYAFPAVTIAVGEVIIVARNFDSFETTFDPVAGTKVFASTSAPVGFALTKDTTLGTGEIGLGNGTASVGDEVLLVKKITDGVYAFVDGMTYGGTTAVTSYTPPGGTAVTFIDARITTLPPELGSLARISAATDTDTAADWRVLTVATPGAVPTNICGDSTLQAGETCDDGNDDPDDGCSAFCETECGFTCVGTGPLSCGEDCGDGDVAGLEECDDGNDLPADGCDPSCRIEAGFTCPEPEPLCDTSPTTKSVCVLDPCLQPLFITEVHADGLLDSESEWIELTNLGPIPIDLASWSFADQATRATAAEGSIRFDVGRSIPAGDTIILAHSGATFAADFGFAPDYEYGADTASAAPYLHRTSDWSPNTNIQLDNGSDQVLLTCGGVMRDIIRWGPAPGDATTVVAPTADFSAANPDAGPFTFERLANARSGSASDWSISQCPSPGIAVNPNGAPEIAAAIVTVPAGQPTTLQLSASDPDADALTFVLDTTGMLGSLVDNDDGTVTYTPPAGPGPFATSFTFTAADACSTSAPAKVDVFVGNATCDVRLSNVRITEVHADARRDNDGEWIELSNNGANAVDLGFLRVGDEESQGGTEGMVVFRAGTMLAPNDSVVIAFAASAFRDDWDLAADREWYRDSDGVDNELPRALAWADGPIRLDNSGDGVIVLGCSGQVIDAVYWGTEPAQGLPVEAIWPKRVRPTPPWDGVSNAGPATLSRRAGADTNSAADWFRERCPTPGVPGSTNAAPVTTDQGFAITTGTTLVDTFDAEDADSSGLVFSATAARGTVTVTAATGAFTFTPPNQAGTYTIEWEVSDGCATATGIVTVCSAANPATCNLDCSPDAPELCDGKDNDCDPATLDGADDPTVGLPCDSPADADLCADEVRTCIGNAVSCPNNVVGDAGRVEACDSANVDEDCDGGADDLDPQGNAQGKAPFYRDIDGDGRGRTNTTQLRCDAGGGYVADGGDCDDDPNQCGNKCSPTLVESRAVGNCSDGRDNDCDQSVDTDAACGEDILCYLDRDGDGFGRFDTEIILSGPTASGGCTNYSDGTNPRGSWVANGLDCDDDATACGAACNPDAPDICDSRDNDCDAGTADGSGDPVVGTACDAAADSDQCLDDRWSCQAGAATCINVASNDALQIEICDVDRRDEDCDGGADDLDPQGAPGTAPLWYRDQDGDGYGDPATGIRGCAKPANHVANGDDCDDNPASCGVACNPAAPDLCDDKDNDCNGGTPDGAGDPAVGIACDATSDADGCLDEVAVCTSGAVQCPNDPDGDLLRVEICDADNVDEDCDGGADDADPDGAPSGTGTWYTDRDGDGHGDPASALVACDAPFGHVAQAGDCDDDPDGCGALCNEGLDETPVGGACADGFDNDCDGITDTDPGCTGGLRCYADSDGDSFGAEADFITIAPAQVPAGGCADYDDGTHAVGYWTAVIGDCDDSDDAINPDASELAGNDVDENCDAAMTCWVDADDDDFAADDAAEADAPNGQTCTAAFRLAAQRGDCDDAETTCGAACNPDAREICDSFDNDCNAKVDDADQCEPAVVGVIGGGEGCTSGPASALGLLVALGLLICRRASSEKRS